MNPDTKQAFFHFKPICDAIMIQPSLETIKPLHVAISNIRNETMQELQYYVLFPIMSHLKSNNLKQELQGLLVDVVKTVSEKSVVNSVEMFCKYHSCLLKLIFEKSQPGMVARGPEELKLSTIECLTAVMLNMDPSVRIKLFQTHIPLLAQTIFVAVHIAKLEKLRALRLAAINCVRVYTGTHRQLTSSVDLESVAVDMVASILPGVVAALQDVATTSDNAGHAVIVAALSAIHSIICMVMNDKYLAHKSIITTEDFVKIFQEKSKTTDDEDRSNKGIIAKNLTKKTPEWFAMAGDKLKLVTQSLMSLQTHDNVKVRKELAVYCAKILQECSRTMRPSAATLVDILIALSKDEYADVSLYSTRQLELYFNNMSDDTRYQMIDSLSENFINTLVTLPRILNNIDSKRKLATLNLLHGYLTIMCDIERPQCLTKVLSLHTTMLTLCHTLIEAVRLESDIGLLAFTNVRYIDSSGLIKSPWCKLVHIDDRQCEERLIEICQLLGSAECTDIVVDQLLELFHNSSTDRKEIAFILNHIASAPSSSITLKYRVLDTYLELDTWYMPLEVGVHDAPPTEDETLDISVYNPRAWDKDNIPGLYEGAIETRYTDITYKTPKLPPVCDSDRCATLAQAQDNIVLCCLLTEGVGILAKSLGDDYQPYLLKTLCLILERVGSKYDMVHQSGVKAITDVANACGHSHVSELIQHNADYFTYQVTTRLKKAWNSQSALEILTVVMEYSDSSIYTCLHGIVADVLVQSCDKYHQNDLSAYLQVFLTFVSCIQKWFPLKDREPNANIKSGDAEDYNVLNDINEYISNVEEEERLLSTTEFEKETGKSIEEMYKEDLKKKEEDLLDYDDTVAEEKLPPPQHITMTVTILKRCLNFVPSKRRAEKLLALQVLDNGLKILRPYEDELLPIVHVIWSPLVIRFTEINEPIVLRKAFELLITMAAVSKDFISNRTIKEVLPNLYKFLQSSSSNSYLKDAGSAYRHSHAYMLQVTVLTALPNLVMDLSLEDKHLDQALNCVQIYLSNKQPRPLQELAVKFFKTLLRYDEGFTWHHLRKLCGNERTLTPPAHLKDLEVIIGTPYYCKDKIYDNNIGLIFDNESST